jgi:hypothetical protein
MSDGVKKVEAAIHRMHGQLVEGVAGALLGLSRLLDAHERNRHRLEQLTTGMCPEDRAAVMAEVERRAVVDGADAYRSVGDDLVSGHWPPAVD